MEFESLTKELLYIGIPEGETAPVDSLLHRKKVKIAA
jgi:hypothetical protein